MTKYNKSKNYKITTGLAVALLLAPNALGSISGTALADEQVNTVEPAGHSSFRGAEDTDESELLFSKIGHYDIKMYSTLLSSTVGNKGYHQPLDLKLDQNDSVEQAYIGFQNEETKESNVNKLKIAKIVLPDGLIGEAPLVKNDTSTRAQQTYYDITALVKKYGAGAYRFEDEFVKSVNFGGDPFGVNSTLNNQNLVVVVKNEKYPVKAVLLSDFFARSDYGSADIIKEIPFTLTNKNINSLLKGGKVTAKTIVQSFDSVIPKSETDDEKGDLLTITFNSGGEDVEVASLDGTGHAPTSLFGAIVGQDQEGIITNNAKKFVFKLLFKNRSIGPESMMWFGVTADLEAVQANYTYIDTDDNSIGNDVKIGESYTDPFGASIPMIIGKDGKISISGKLGTPIPKGQTEIPGYTFLPNESTKDDNLKFEVGGSELKYVYKAKGQKIDIKYIDDATGEIIHVNDTPITGTTNQQVPSNLPLWNYSEKNYDFVRFEDVSELGPKTLHVINGKELSGTFTTSETKNADGTINPTETDQTINIHLKKKNENPSRPSATVKYRFVTKIKNNDGTIEDNLLKENVLNLKVGDPYGLANTALPGYKLTGIDNPLSGIADGDKVITLTFENVDSNEVNIPAKITFRFVDDKGNEIKKADILDTFVGTGYDYTAPEISGYSFKEANDLLKDNIKGDKTITLTYTKNEDTPSTPDPTPDVTPDSNNGTGNESGNEDTNNQNSGTNQNENQVPNQNTESTQTDSSNKNKESSANNNQTNNNETLPQTDEKDSSLYTLFGLLSLTAASILSFLGFKKKTEK